MRFARSLKLAGLLLLAGCVHVAHEPALDFPARPSVTFFQARWGSA